MLEVAVKTERLARGESAETAAFEPTRTDADSIRNYLRAAGLIDQPSDGDESHDEVIQRWLENSTVEGDDTEEDDDAGAISALGPDL